MSFNIIINIDEIETNISDSYIIQASSTITNKTKFNFDDMISATTEFILDDITGDFNPDNPDSIFYGEDWYNGIVSIYNNNILVWNGLLKKIKYSGSQRTLTVKTKNYIQEIIDKECSLIIGTGSTEYVTPAEIVLEILKEWVEIPESNINQVGFNKAISWQTSNNIFVELRLGQDNSISSSNIILELCRMTGAYLYAEDNIVNFFQPLAYGGELGEEIKSSDIKEKTFNVEYDDKEIVNYANIFCIESGVVESISSKEYSFEITLSTINGSATATVTNFGPTGTSSLPPDTSNYLKKGYRINGASVPAYTTIIDYDIDANTITFSENATATSEDIYKTFSLEPVNPDYILTSTVYNSFNRYALKQYKLVQNTPSENTDDKSNHILLIKTENAANTIIDLKTTLNTSMKKYCNLVLDYNKNFIKLNDQLDLTFDYFVREPVRVIDKKVDTNKKTVSIKCEFLNSPYEYYARDIIPPQDFPIFSYFYDANQLIINWKKQPNVNYYKIYYGGEETNFEGIASQGVSPLTIISPDENSNNQYYKLLSGISFIKYYTKMTSIDSSENESDYSNVFEPINIEDGTNEKRYKITSDSEIYKGIQAQYNLSGETWLPPNMNYYNGLNYDSDTYSFLGAFETGIIGNNKGINNVIWKINNYNTDVYMQYREYNPNTLTFGSWSTLINTTNRYFKFNLGGIKGVQFRIYLPDNVTIIYLEDIQQI